MTGKIIQQMGRYTLRTARKGYEIYRDEGVASVRCDTITYEGQAGLTRAWLVLCRRAGNDGLKPCR